MVTGEPPERRNPVRVVPGLLWLAVTVALVAAAPYVRTVGFEFTYDDHAHVVRNPFLQDPGDAWGAFSWGYFDRQIPDQGRPVLLASLLVDRSVGGADPAVHHAQNVAWHIVVSVLVFMLALRLGLGPLAAALAGWLFALHPVHAEAVAGVSNREDLLATCFVLGALLLARRALSEGSLPRLAAMTALYGVGLLSKESAVVMPVLLVWIAACFPCWRPPAHLARRVYSSTAVALALVTLGWAGFQLRLGYPALVPAAGGTGLEVSSQDGEAHPRPSLSRMGSGSGALLYAGMVQISPASPADEPDGESEQPSRLPHGKLSPVHALSIEPFRAWQLLVPWPLSAEYDLEPFRAPWALALGGLSLALLGLVAIRGWRGSRALTFGIGWFLIATLPVLLPNLIINPLSDRYLYLPAVGTCVLLGWGVLEWWPARRRRHGTWAGVAAVVLLLAYTSIGAARIGVWKNDIALFGDAARHAPHSARVHHNLGAARLRAGDHEGARAALLEAVELDPHHLAARLGLGMVAERQRRFAEAARQYRRALEAPTIVAEAPLRDRALRRLHRMLRELRREEELRPIVAHELRRRPDSPVVRELARELEASGRGSTPP